MAWFNKNKELICPNCHRSDGLLLVWSGGDNHRGMHEDDFVCNLCKCEFTAKYKICDIEICVEGDSKQRPKIDTPSPPYPCGSIAQGMINTILGRK